MTAVEDTVHAARLHTPFGDFFLSAFPARDGSANMAMWLGDLREMKPMLVRVQSSCITSTALLGDVCDCAGQIRLSFSAISAEGRGLFIYLAQEGRGLGLYEKIAGIAEMNRGADTVTAYSERGLPVDVRDYSDVASIISRLGIQSAIRAMTNNPLKLRALRDQGFAAVERVPVEVEPTERTRQYLKTKKEKLGHLLNLV